MLPPAGWRRFRLSDGARRAMIQHPPGSGETIREREDAPPKKSRGEQETHAQAWGAAGRAIQSGEGRMSYPV